MLRILIVLAICVYGASAFAQSPGSSLINKYSRWPVPLTEADERAIASDLAAVCEEALSAVMPLNNEEKEWLDKVAPMHEGLGRAPSGSIAAIVLESSAYVRDALASNLKFCISVMNSKFPSRLADGGSFVSRWSAALHVAGILERSRDNFDLAASKGWVLGKPKAAPALGYGQYFSTISIFLHFNALVYMAKNF